MKYKWWIIAAAAVAIGCAQVKQFGQQMGGPIGASITEAANIGEVQLLNEKDEQVMGRSMAITIVNTYPLSTDKNLTAYINYIGQTLVTVSPKPDRHYIFGVLESDKVGAYSAPDGYVFITKGAIQFAQDESELAGVIGHELTHVIRQHGLDAAKAEMTRAGIMKIGTDIGVQDAVPAMDKLGDVITKTGFDKPQEFEADQGSIKLLVAAGYDPNGLLNYLKRLDAQESSGNGGGLMSTHPGTHERVGKVQQQITSLGNIGGATLKDRFKANVSPTVAFNSRAFTLDE